MSDEEKRIIIRRPRDLLRIPLEFEEMLIIAEELRPRPLVKIVEKPPEPKPTKLIIDKKTHKVRGTYTFLNERGWGVIKEIMIDSPSTAYGVAVYRDGKRVWDESFDDYRTLSPKIDEIFVDEDAYNVGEYVLHLSNVEFAKHVLAMLRVTTPITFSRIYVAGWIVRS